MNVKLILNESVPDKTSTKYYEGDKIKFISRNISNASQMHPRMQSGKYCVN